MVEKGDKSNRNHWYLRPHLWGPCLLLIISVGLAIAYIITSSNRTLTELEGTMFQFFILSLGLLASYIIGKHSAKQAAFDLIKPHARSAFRRLIFLYQSLSRLALAIEDGKENNPSGEKDYVLEKLEAIVIEQIATANDSLEDWRDIVPEEVEELINRISKSENEK